MRSRVGLPACAGFDCLAIEVADRRVSNARVPAENEDLPRPAGVAYPSSYCRQRGLDHRESEEGSAGLITLLGCLIIIPVASGVAALASISGLHATVDSAADLTALAVAESLMTQANPCKHGSQTASANNAKIEDCEISGLTAGVRVSVALPVALGLRGGSPSVEGDLRCLPPVGRPKKQR